MDCLLKKRLDFPALQRKVHGYPLVYLDSAATALKPESVIEAVANFDRQLGTTVHRGVYTTVQEATTLYQEARTKVQQFLGAKHFEEIIFTRGTTSSLNLLAHSFIPAFCKPADVILLSEIEHHSNLIPWQMAAQAYGVQLRFIPVNDQGELEFDGLIDEKVKLVSLAHISNVLGTLHPVETLIQQAHAVGAYVCLDGAQSAPHLPIHLQQLDVDFFACSGHKLYGPTGVGILYGKKQLLERMSPVEGGGDMLELATLQDYTPNQLPYKFEAGTPMIGQVIGLGAAIDYLQEIGMVKIAEYESFLLAYATEALNKVKGLRILGTAAHKGAIISFVVEGVHPLDIATMLDCRGFALRSGHHCSQPTMQRFGVSATCRISFGVYNTQEDIDQFVYHLKSILEIFQ